MNPHKWHKRPTGLTALVEVLITGSVAGIAERGTNYGSSTVKQCPQRAFKSTTSSTNRKESRCTLYTYELDMHMSNIHL
jgi:hypothetical protein